MKTLGSNSFSEEVSKKFEEYKNMSQKLKDLEKKLDTDSDAYSHIGKKCVLCREVIVKHDVQSPNFIMQNNNGPEVCHAQCMDYCIKKYPNVSMTELYGKIRRNTKWKM